MKTIYGMMAGIRAGVPTRSGRLYSREILEEMLKKARPLVTNNSMLIYEGERAVLTKAIGVIQELLMGQILGDVGFRAHVIDPPDGRPNPLYQNGLVSDDVYMIGHGTVETKMIEGREVQIVTEVILEYLYVPEEEEKGDGDEQSK